jgi:hypothetical protein
MTPATFVRRLGWADLEVFLGRLTPWFRMSTSRKPVSLNEDMDAHILV